MVLRWTLNYFPLFESMFGSVSEANNSIQAHSVNWIKSVQQLRLWTALQALPLITRTSLILLFFGQSTSSLKLTMIVNSELLEFLITITGHSECLRLLKDFQFQGLSIFTISVWLKAAVFEVNKNSSIPVVSEPQACWVSTGLWSC